MEKLNTKILLICSKGGYVDMGNKNVGHPVVKDTYKELYFEDFISREEFIKRTGIFVSPDYFTYIHNVLFKKSGVSIDEFIRNYEKKYSVCVQKVELHGTFKYEIMDDGISLIGQYEDCHEPNIWEIINTLVRNIKIEYEDKHKIAEKYNEMLYSFQNISSELLKEIVILIETVNMAKLQINVTRELLKYMMNNQTIETEITQNPILKDMFEISLDQLLMICHEMDKKINNVNQLNELLHNEINKL